MIAAILAVAKVILDSLDTILAVAKVISVSRESNLVAIELDVAVIEPLICVPEVVPNEEFHTPVVTVPTEVTLVCAAVASVPSTLVASTLPYEPVELTEPLTFPVVVISSNVISSTIFSPVTALSAIGPCPQIYSEMDRFLRMPYNYSLIVSM